MQQMKTVTAEEACSNDDSRFQQFMDEHDTLSEGEKKDSFAKTVYLYNHGDISLTVVSLMALAIAGNTKGTEYFREFIPFEVREAYYNSSYALQTDESPVTLIFFQNMFIGDKSENINHDALQVA